MNVGDGAVVIDAQPARNDSVAPCQFPPQPRMCESQFVTHDVYGSAILACGRPPPLRSGGFVLTKSNSSGKIKRPAPLCFDGVHPPPGMVFGFPPECCSA